MDFCYQGGGGDLKIWKIVLRIMWTFPKEGRKKIFDLFF
jgi:hypothetical protein